MLLRSKTFIAVGIAIFVINAHQSSPLYAQSFSASPGQNLELDLDTPDGHFSSWDKKDLGSLSAVRATISIPRLGNDPKYGPYFTVRVDVSGKPYGVRMVRAAGASRVSLQSYYREPKNPDVVVSTFKRTIGVNEQIDIELSWKDGRLSVRVGDEISEIPLPAPVSYVSISSSTGEIRANVALGEIR
jgi:hypothetical protein